MNNETDVHYENITIDYEAEYRRLLEAVNVLLREYRGIDVRPDIHTWTDDENTTIQVVSANPRLLTICITSRGDEADDVLVETIRFTLSLAGNRVSYDMGNHQPEDLSKDHFGCTVIADSIGYIYDGIQLLSAANDSDKSVE